MQEKKVKVLCLFDTPTGSTGFGQVSKNILKVLQATGKYEFDIVGVNFDGNYYDREEYPYKIFPAMNPLIQSIAYRDPFGKQVFLDKLTKYEHDLVFIIQDTFQICPLAPYIIEAYDKAPADRKFKWIYYYPIDAAPKKNWITESVFFADYPVAYTKYAMDETMKVFGDSDEDKLKAEIIKSKLNVIYHGVNREHFNAFNMTPELKKELKSKYFPPNVQDKFIFMNLNRNQPRKDLFRSLQVAKMLTDRRAAKGKNDAYFYFHCLFVDSGGDITQMASQIGLNGEALYGFGNPNRFNTIHGYPIAKVNEIYNAVDAVFSTTLGEGFGLSMIEGMATRKPVIFPRNTCIPEIIGSNQERGILADCGKNPNQFVVVPTIDNDRVRPVTDVEDMVNKMEDLLDNREKYNDMVQRAFEYAEALDWDGALVGQKWKDLFNGALEAVEEDRKAQATDFSKLGRNDDCPICKIKLKKCKHNEFSHM